MSLHCRMRTHEASKCCYVFTTCMSVSKFQSCSCWISWNASQKLDELSQNLRCTSLRKVGAKILFCSFGTVNRNSRISNRPAIELIIIACSWFGMRMHSSSCLFLSPPSFSPPKIALFSFLLRSPPSFTSLLLHLSLPGVIKTFWGCGKKPCWIWSGEEEENKDKENVFPLRNNSDFKKGNLYLEKR